MMFESQSASMRWPCAMLFIAAAGASIDRPHVVMIVADDLGIGDLPLFAHPNTTAIQSPNLDALGAESAVLDRYYTTPMCSPSRAALMTGRYPIRYGLQDFVINPTDRYGLNLNETLLPEVLRANGYETRMVGKWHLGQYSYESTPTFRGFESFFGYYGDMEGYFNKKLLGGFDHRRDKTVRCGANCSEVAWNETGKYSTHAFAEEAEKIIQDRDQSRPLFLYLAFQAVHYPDEVPEEYMKPYEGVIKDSTRRTLAGMVTCLDEAVGNVTRALKAAGMYDDTVIIFTTDNGAPTSKKTDLQLDGTQGGVNWPLRGGKHTAWDGGVRGPAMIKYKSLPPQRFQRLSGIIDWFATVLELAGINWKPKPEFPLDSVSLVGALRGGPRPHSHILINIESKPYNRAAVVVESSTSTWKLITGQPGPPDGWKIPSECDTNVCKPPLNRSWWSPGVKCVEPCLFDLKNDQVEAHDIADFHKDEVKRLSSLLEDYKRNGFFPSYATGQPCSKCDKDPNCTLKGGCRKDSKSALEAMIKAGGAWTPWISFASLSSHSMPPDFVNWV